MKQTIFCERDLFFLKEPTNRSHPISRHTRERVCLKSLSIFLKSLSRLSHVCLDMGWLRFVPTNRSHPISRHTRESMERLFRHTREYLDTHTLSLSFSDDERFSQHQRVCLKSLSIFLILRYSLIIRDILSNMPVCILCVSIERFLLSLCYLERESVCVCVSERKRERVCVCLDHLSIDTHRLSRHTHTLSLFLSDTHTHTLSLSLSLRHAHTHTLSLSFSQTHSHTLSLSLFPPDTLIHTLSLFLPHTHTHAHKLSLSFSQTHSHTHTVFFPLHLDYLSIWCGYDESAP